MSKACLFLLVAALLVTISINKCQAQKIDLKDVVSFKLHWREGGLSDSYSDVEVLYEDTSWVSYQIHFKMYESNDSTRKFIKRVPRYLLEQLLSIIAKDDTGENVAPFKIKNQELIKYVDSIKADLKPAQKKELIDSLSAEPTLKLGLAKALQPIMKDDRAHYSITIVTKQNKNFTIDAYSFAYLYLLPWYIKGIKNYDPNITLAYEFISGYDKYAVTEKRRLYHDVTWEIYKEYFMTRFNWANFKTDQPESFSMLNNTLVPRYFYRDGTRTSIIFKSSLLPSYVELPFFCRYGDTSGISSLKRYEHILASIFKKNIFLFDHLSKKPGYRIVFDYDKMSRGGKYIFSDIKKYYAGIDSFDYEKCQFGEIYKDRKVDSEWIFLPNNTLIMVADLVDAPGSLLHDKITLSDGYSEFPHQRSVCIIFDANGNILQNYGLADIATQY